MSATLFTTSRGVELTQLPDRFPLLGYLYTNFEKTYNCTPGVEFAKANPMIPIVLVSVYMASIYFGQKYMATRERFDLRNNLAMWNLFLCTFSFMGAMRTVPHLMYNLTNMSLEQTMTQVSANDWGDGATGLWVQLFIFSKIPELWDTFYIVARQRPLLFLHWYHHVTVLLYCWHSYATEAPQALYFVAMNYSVHAIMYGYYCLMALKMKPKWIPPVLITVAQLSQMVVGTSVQLFSMYLYYTKGEATNLNLSNLVAGAIMYGSYFALFFQFFWNRFVVKARASAKAKAL
mmetsp:Transcript_1933/g.4330  ORF Transcript_1933/g.4330 Transcript_1933/m.4330 type:complete len:290 (-) Transcript_1933:237-1106(-)|eukprot:CAMPEP_0182572338 /NCGR_PEP_ID=MMETSP1324-20130603/15942_1 /TAXON_ID=236786 /ORGANISM="Florenciella sp., Strain RCC1587" /LENGTH=289 /DNA_ID=CAMNT_0024787195 /DNA_START=76 /DNA_END=945 /DNA_ORIENTATION=-